MNPENNFPKSHVTQLSCGISFQELQIDYLQSKKSLDVLQGFSADDAAEKPAAVANSWASLASLWRQVTGPARRFHEHLASDQAFADHVGRSLDLWAAAISFLLYTICAILIFTINGALYGTGRDANFGLLDRALLPLLVSLVWQITGIYGARDLSAYEKIYVCWDGNLHLVCINPWSREQPPIVPCELVGAG